jgi:cyanophycinase
VADIHPIFVSPDRRPVGADFDGATGVFVCGGLTPAYHDAICLTGNSWLPALLDRGIPYGGFSAGAAIAAEQSIVGGWKLRNGDTDLIICAEDVSEDEEYLAVRPGLGLVPFAVDVHAAQWGTLARLLHAVRTGAVAEGWAIDEDTLLRVSDGTINVHGLGCAHHVRRANGSLSVETVSGVAAP